MSARDYIQSVIICDEVRTEITGKDIAIGIFNGTMIVPRIPFVIPMLAVRFELNFFGEFQQTMELRLQDPNHNMIIEQKMPIKFNDWSKPGAITLNMEGLILPVEGAYLFEVKFNDDWLPAKGLLIEKFNRSRMLEGWRDRMKAMEENIKNVTPEKT
jgi:hypothetical protein